MSSEDMPMSFNSARVLGRSCESLLGICKGLLADRVLNEDEAVFLDSWLRDNPEIASVWPGCVIADRVRSTLSDGVVTADELEQLKDVLSSLIGGSPEQTGAVGGLSTKLPVNMDAAIEFEQRCFCFTGKFLYGSRRACETAVATHGGYFSRAITKQLDYLVIGTLISPDWMYSTHGRKIESAMERQKAGSSLFIVCEDQWIDALNNFSHSV